jgi:hypothetical protein
MNVFSAVVFHLLSDPVSEFGSEFTLDDPECEVKARCDTTGSKEIPVVNYLGINDFGIRLSKVFESTSVSRRKTIFGQSSCGYDHSSSTDPRNCGIVIIQLNKCVRQVAILGFSPCPLFGTVIPAAAGNDDEIGVCLLKHSIGFNPKAVASGYPVSRRECIEINGEISAPGSGILEYFVGADGI